MRPDAITASLQPDRDSRNDIVVTLGILRLSTGGSRTGETTVQNEEGLMLTCLKRTDQAGDCGRGLYAAAAKRSKVSSEASSCTIFAA